MNFAAHCAFELPMSLRRNKNWRFKFDRSMVSISMTWISQKPINAKSLSSSQPKPPAPITKILNDFIISWRLSNDGVNSDGQNGPDRSSILRMCVHRRWWWSTSHDDGGDDDTSISLRLLFVCFELVIFAWIECCVSSKNITVQEKINVATRTAAAAVAKCNNYYTCMSGTRFHDCLSQSPNENTHSNGQISNVLFNTPTNLKYWTSLR